MNAETSSGPLALLADWMSRRSTLVLSILLLQIGLFVGLIHAWQTGAAARNPMRSGTRAISAAGCGPTVVRFSEASTEGDLRRWLVNFEANIVAGPDSRGAFELAVPRLTIAQVREALGPLAEEVSANPLCPATDEQ